MWNHAWGPWWWWTSLSEVVRHGGALPWRTTLLRWPEGGVLWFIDPLLALVGAPLVPLLGAAGAWNLALLASVVFTSWAGAVFARALGEGRPVSVLAQSVASAALAGGALVLAALHNGISEALHLGTVALALAAGEQALVQPTPGRWARAGLGVGLVAWVSPYLGLGAGLALAARVLAGLPAAGRRGRAVLLRGAIMAGLLSMLVALPGLLPLVTQLGATDALVRRPEAMDEALALRNALDPRALLLPRSARLTDEGFAITAYLGLASLGLALLHHRRAWLAGAACCAVLALGPWLSWGGAWVELSGERVPLPWRAVQLLTPSMALTHASRLAAPAAVIVAGLAGLGAERLAGALGRRAWLGFGLPALALADGLLASGVPWPLSTAPAEIPAVYAALPAGQSGGQGVLDLPTDAGATMATSRYLYWQTAHGLPIPYAPDARASTASLLDDPFFRALASLCRRRPDEAAALRLEGIPPELAAAEARPERLRDRGYRWIVLHQDLDPAAAPALEALLRAALGPGEVVGGSIRWDLAARATGQAHGR